MDLQLHLLLHSSVRRRGRAPFQSLADLEEAIPNSMETSLAEVNHAPPSATKMAPVTYEDTQLARKSVQ